MIKKTLNPFLCFELDRCFPPSSTISVAGGGLGKRAWLKAYENSQPEIQLQDLTKSTGILGLSAVSHFAQDFPGYLLNKTQWLGLHLKTEATESPWE